MKIQLMLGSESYDIELSHLEAEDLFGWARVHLPLVLESYKAQNPGFGYRFIDEDLNYISVESTYDALLDQSYLDDEDSWHGLFYICSGFENNELNDADTSLNEWQQGLLKIISQA